MRKRECLILVGALFLALVVAPLALADRDEDEQEESISFAQLPVAVQQAVKKAYPNAAIRECERETEHGRVEYKVELKVDDREIKLEFAADGTLTEQKEEIPPARLPSTISTAVKTLIPGGKLAEAESKVKHGATTYEVAVRCGKITLKLKFDQSGKLLRIKPKSDNDHEEGARHHEEQEKDDDD